DLRSRGFFGLIVIYLVVCVSLYFLQNRPGYESKNATGSGQQHIESRLLAFDEALEFFGGTLKLPDMFRLVSSRIEELIPFQMSALFLVDEAKIRLSVAECAGADREAIASRSMRIDEGLAGKCYTDAAVTIGPDSVAKIETSDGFVKAEKFALTIPLLG